MSKRTVLIVNCSSCSQSHRVRVTTYAFHEEAVCPNTQEVVYVTHSDQSFEVERVDHFMKCKTTDKVGKLSQLHQMDCGEWIYVLHDIQTNKQIGCGRMEFLKTEFEEATIDQPG